MDRPDLLSGFSCLEVWSPRSSSRASTPMSCVSRPSSCGGACPPSARV